MKKELKCTKNLTLDFVDKEFEFFVNLSEFLGITVDDLLSMVISNYYHDCFKSGAVTTFYVLFENRRAEDKELN